MEDIDPIIRDLVRRDMREFLGGLRSLASELKHAGRISDEEECFRKLLVAFCQGIRDEMSKLTGPERASRLLDPFSRPDGEAN